MKNRTKLYKLRLHILFITASLGLVLFSTCANEINNPSDPNSPDFLTNHVVSCILSSCFVSNSGALTSPVVSPVAGTYAPGQTITMTTTTSGAIILYTTDNSAPSHDGSGSPTGTTMLYSSPIALAVTTTIKFISYVDGVGDSAVTTVNYTITLGTVASPTFSPVAGVYGSAQSVALSCATGGATILYTVDGNDPTHDGSGNPTGTTALFGANINVAVTTTIKAIGYLVGYNDSSISTAAYTIDTTDPGTNSFTYALKSWSKITGTANIDENGTGYCVATPNGAAAPTVPQIIAGSGGTIVGFGGSVGMTAGVNASCVVTSLTANTSYDVYFVAQDTVLNSGTSSLFNATTTNTNNYRTYTTGLYSTGNLKGAAANGVAGADEKCNAGGKPTTSVYKALIVDGVNRVASLTANAGDGQIDWVFRPNQNYYRSNGSTLVMTTDANGLFVFGTLTNPFGTISARSNWMGLGAGWVTNASLCSNWTSSSGAQNGRVGYLINPGGAAINWGNQPCDGTGTHSMSLLCIEQYE